jgi:hypothetical protein
MVVKMTNKQAAALKKAQKAAAIKRAEKSAQIPSEPISAPETLSAPILSEDRNELISKLDKLIEINAAILEILKKNSTSDKIDMSKLVK